MSGFLSRSFCTYTSKEYFVIDRGLAERVPPCFACAEVRAETETVASSHPFNRLRSLQSATPSMLLLSYKGKMVTQSG